MYLCALGKPTKGFDGKIAMEPVTEEREADRLNRSKGRVKGDIYDADVTMDCDKYYEMMTKQIFPARPSRVRASSVWWCSRTARGRTRARAT